MTNLFEDEGDDFLALANDEGQYSLWPRRLDVPMGWNVVHGPSKRRACLDYIEMHWTDMRPKSLTRLMDVADAELAAKGGSPQ